MYNCTFSFDEGTGQIMPVDRIPQLQDWNIERLTIGCSETNPIEVESFLYTEAQQFEFDMHYSLELGIVVEGQMDRYYREGNRSYGTGEVWLCGMWEPHGWAVQVPPSDVIVCFLYPPFLARTFFHEAPEINWLAPFTVPWNSRPTIRQNRRSDVLQIAQDIRKNHSSTSNLKKVTLHLRILELIGIMLDSWDSQPATKRHIREDYDLIGRAMRIVFDSSDFVTATEAARACGMNRNRLSRLFTDYTGMSFAEFALRYRVSSAAEQLRKTEEPIKAIAVNWGFSDASHFFRSFAKFYGCSPSDYRRNSRMAEERILLSKSTFAGER